MFEHGLDDVSLSGLLPFAELCGQVSPPGILPGFLVKEFAGSYKDTAASAGEALPLPSSTSTARPLRLRITVGAGFPQRRGFKADGPASWSRKALMKSQAKSGARDARGANLQPS